jgi:hypothetical protein
MEDKTPSTPVPVSTPAAASEPNTQAEKGFRAGWVDWMKELPRIRFEPPEPDIRAPLIDQQKLEVLLQEKYPKEFEEIKADIEYMNHELLRLFRQRDHEAKHQQNRYRLYQICYLILAAIAAALGASQALALAGNPDSVPWWSAAETIVALLVTFLASISGRQMPLPLWLMNRQRAERLRQEYFRYLMHVPPYDNPVAYQREMLLSRRAADINRGVNPDEQGDILHG